MTDERYNGWTNRETWALNLWLSNDGGLYHCAQALADDYAEAYDRAQAFREWVTDDLFSAETLEHGSTQLRNMRDEVGSLWRVDWDAIAEAWQPEAVEA